MLPYEDVIAESGLVEKPVLISQRTQSLLLMALSQIEPRYQWQIMDDGDWDELEDYLSQAITEILTENNNSMTITTIGLQRTSNVSASTFPYVVPFETGNGYDSGNPTRLTPGTGDSIIHANIHFSAGSANVGYVEIRKNTGVGTITLARHDLSGVTTNYVNLSAIDTPDADDFYELVIQSNVPITIQTGVFFPKLECKVFA